MSRLFAITVLFIAPVLAQDVVPELEILLGQGISQYQKGNYNSAIQTFERIGDMNPAASHWYLSQIFVKQYAPGSKQPDNMELAVKAKNEFEQLLQLNKDNGVIMASLGCLSYEEALAYDDARDKEAKLEDARNWFQRWLAADAESRPAHYALGVIDTQKLFFALMAARAKIGMKPDVLAPLTDPDVRHEVSEKLAPVIEDGLSHFKYALEIEPMDDGAMMFMGILIRERADLRDTQEEFNKDVAASKVWGEKSRHAKATRPAHNDAIAGPMGLPAMVPPVPPGCGRSERRTP